MQADLTARTLRPHLDEIRDAAVDTPLDRYFRILEMAAGFPGGITLSQLVEVLALPKSTVHRLLRSLVAAGLLTARAPRYGPYVLGGRLLNLLYGGMSDDWVEWLVRPLLQELADRTGETCFLTRLSDLQVHSVAMVTPENDVRSYVVPGRILPAHAAASAKAILAFQSETVVRAILSGPLPVMTERTKTRLKDLQAEHAEIRETRIALCVGEDVPGFAGIASPIIIPGFDVKYSIAITGTIEALIERQQATYSELLRAFADRIAIAMSVRLGQAEQKTSKRPEPK
ncbi:IclR family transcriptional regulator [Dongia mobilis]|uniref:IclR family transcriptional regulator n=1 Tax=Dongia mobilis TaxID=578943 RepID=A0A4R6WWR7_9PROT|nr:IclR family transcriptional regulator [Dongia mobilis]TDQ84127.1 IclR family transcriptional regulator [Dongia mobilis]